MSKSPIEVFIEQRSLEGRATIFLNAIKKIDCGDKSAEALIEQIKLIWADGVDKLPQLVTRDRPKFGVMQALGYRVGKSGEDLPTRRIVLKFAFSSEVLPPIQDRSYMSEWGTAYTSKRLQKILSFLSEEAKDLHDDPRNHYAVSDWLSDFDYARAAFTGLVANA